MNNIKPIIPQLAQIKNYTPALKIGDKYFVNGIGGNFVPSGAGSMDFYKCASVDTTNQTWTGYKAVQDQVTHIYSYEATATSGLTYSVVTPAIGKVYADGALIEASLYVGIPVNGLVFYASLSETSETVQGIPCTYFNGTRYLNFSDNDLPHPNVFSVSLWAKGNVQDQQRCCVSWGTNEDNESFGIMLNPNGTLKTVGAKNADNEWTSQSGTIDTSGWNHICVVNYGTYEIIYVNGDYVGTFNWERNITLSSGFIGAMTDEDWMMIGYLAAIRIYNRVLTTNEIATLAAEFTPIVS